MGVRVRKSVGRVGVRVRERPRKEREAASGCEGKG